MGVFLKPQSTNRPTTSTFVPTPRPPPPCTRPSGSSLLFVVMKGLGQGKGESRFDVYFHSEWASYGFGGHPSSPSTSHHLFLLFPPGDVIPPPQPPTHSPLRTVV